MVVIVVILLNCMLYRYLEYCIGVKCNLKWAMAPLVYNFRSFPTPLQFEMSHLRGKYLHLRVSEMANIFVISLVVRSKGHLMHFCPFSPTTTLLCTTIVFR